jgi:hypothetical protein
MSANLAVVCAGGDKIEVNLPSAFLFTDVSISMHEVSIFM